MGSLVGGVFGSELPVEMNAVRGIPQIGPAIIAILFFGFGTLAARRYSTTGLRVVCIISLFLLSHFIGEHLTKTDFDKNILKLFFIIYF